VWFDRDILRINFDNHGEYLGEFHNDDKILAIRKNGEFDIMPVDLNNHFDDDLMVIEKFDPAKVWSAALYDASQQGYPYIKRFTLEAGARRQNCLGENKDNQLIWFSETPFPRIQVMFGGNDNFREPLVIEVDEFIGVKSYKARGKRLTTYEIDEIIELEPTKFPPPPEVPEEAEVEEPATETGEQLSLFDSDSNNE
jgi:topoisomerase-4 subunit A